MKLKKYQEIAAMSRDHNTLTRELRLHGFYFLDSKSVCSGDVYSRTSAVDERVECARDEHD
jgi:hypothetical protein